MKVRLQSTIWCHPGSLYWLQAQLGPYCPPDPHGVAMFRGMPIKTSIVVPEFVRERRWIPPSGRFWECEQSDRAWCEPLGLGRWEEVETGERVFWRIPDELPLAKKDVCFVKDSPFDWSPHTIIIAQKYFMMGVRA